MKVKELAEIVQGFNEISGIEIAVSNTKGHMCFSKKRTSKFCNLIHSSAEALEICRETDARYVCDVKRTNNCVGYTCPFGIVEFIAPLEYHGVDYGLFFCSLGFRKEGFDKEAMLDKIEKIASGIPRDQLSEEIDRVPKFSEDERRAYESLARVIAKYISIEELVSDEDLSIGTMVKNYIKNNITGDITLSDISYHLHLSTVSLTQHFRLEFGMTIMQYVMKLRLKMAEQILISTDVSIKEAAVRAGFAEPEYFSRCFKKHYGMTPSEYREKNRSRIGTNE